MTAPDEHSSWGWFNDAAGDPQSWSGQEEPDEELTSVFARCFATADGRKVLRHLRRVAFERALGPASTDAHLRHADGQRQLVVYILALISKGTSVPQLHR